MSELINNSGSRLKALTGFSRGIVNGEKGRELIELYRTELDTVTPAETMQVFDQLLLEGIPTEKVKAGVGKILNVFYKSLSSQTWQKPESDHFLSLLMQENREVEKIMADMKLVIKQIFNAPDPDFPELFQNLRQQHSKLKAYELHYIKKENILFPYIEKAFPQFRCLQLMWSFHDDFRRSMKNLETILNSENPVKENLNKELGKLFFVVFPIIFREEQIVFPVAYRAIPAPLWDEMLQQSFEIGYCYLTPEKSSTKNDQLSSSSGKLNLGTGSLSIEQVILLLNNLPVDMTFVDENDEVSYFSGGKHRIFPRSKAIIGRKVQNCHPPESVHVVNEIVEAFRTGQKDHADFWIQMKGRFIHIRYFAIRDESGNYKGTLEVSQDVTEIRQLSGERRLLDWTS